MFFCVDLKDALSAEKPLHTASVHCRFDDETLIIVTVMCTQEGNRSWTIACIYICGSNPVDMNDYLCN